MTRARWTLLASFALAACHGTPLNKKACQQDSDCGSPASAFLCEPTTGVCYCRNDQACQPTQFCNAAGFCQNRAGCQTDQDCLDPTLYCDTTSGSCLPKGRCAVDVDCQLGQVCDLDTQTCVTGCRSNGDCAGTSCRCGDAGCGCTANDQLSRQSCSIGVCDPYFCADKTFCRYGQQCGLLLDAGVPYTQCYSDYDPTYRPYCATCTAGGGIQTCGVGPNFCLVDTAHPGSFFCGSDCSTGQICPRGYSCQDVIVVGLPGTQQCARANPVCNPNPSLPCRVSADCRRGGLCAVPFGQDAGYCTGQCALNEGDPEGFCTCLVDGDCPQESCSANQCSISRRPCITAADCHFIHCVDFQGAGGCFVGDNCAPSDGLTCLEVE